MNRPAPVPRPSRPRGEPGLDLVSYARKILSARVYDVAVESPLDPMPRLAAASGCTR